MWTLKVVYLGLNLILLLFLGRLTKDSSHLPPVMWNGSRSPSSKINGGQKEGEGKTN